MMRLEANCAMTRCRLTALIVSILVTASGVKAAHVTVEGVTGNPTAQGPNGEPVNLDASAVIPDGAVIETDDTSRIALSIASSEDAAADARDLLVIGSDSRVELHAMESESDSDVAAFGLAAHLKDGSARLISRSDPEQPTARIAIDERIVIPSKADMIARYDGELDHADLYVLSGVIVIEIGARTIKLRPGLQRRIEGARVLGAQSFESPEWYEIAKLMDVEGVETPDPNVSKVTSSSSKPAESKPAEENAGGGDSNAAPSSASNESSPLVNDQPVYVALRTSMGDIYLELDPVNAPITVANFLSYLEDEFYDGTIFHRVMDGFMIQGGGFTADLTKKATKEPIHNEWRNGLENDRGTIAMARTSSPHSATSQFFINVVDNDALNGSATRPGYAVFGRVVAGMNVVDAVRQVPTSPIGGHNAVPDEPVFINQVERVRREEAMGE